MGKFLALHNAYYASAADETTPEKWDSQHGWLCRTFARIIKPTQNRIIAVAARAKEMQTAFPRVTEPPERTHIQLVATSNATLDRVGRTP